MSDDLGRRLRRRRGRFGRFLRRTFFVIVVLFAALAAYAWATGARQDPIETGEPEMKAVVYTEYGAPDVLELRDVQKPVPTDD